MTDDVPDQPLTPNYVHVVRTAQTIHLQLSQMADQKASILMGATFVIFTLVIGRAVPGQVPPLPLAILGGFAFVAGVLSMLAVMPATSSGGPPTPAGINLLFFGSFATLDEDDFVARLREAVSSDHRAIEVMARDLYRNGRLLKRKKYRLLGWAYRVFLVGLVASFAAFVAGLAAPGLF